MRQTAIAVKTSLTRRAADLGRWILAYRWFWAVIAAALVGTWPGWYAADARWESIMVGVFGTLLVTPFLVIGVDQVIRRTQEARQKPRRAALVEELCGALSGCISLPALGNVEILLPGYLAKATAAFSAEGQFDEDGLYLVDLLVEETLTRHDEVFARLYQRGFEDLAKVMRAASIERDDLQRRLFEAGDAIAPDVYARVVKLLHALRRIGRNAELADELVKGSYDKTGAAALLLRKTFTTQYLDAITAAGELYRRCRAQ